MRALAIDEMEGGPQHPGDRGRAPPKPPVREPHGEAERTRLTRFSDAARESECAALAAGQAQKNRNNAPRPLLIPRQQPIPVVLLSHPHAHRAAGAIARGPLGCRGSVGRECSVLVQKSPGPGGRSWPNPIAVALPSVVKGVSRLSSRLSAAPMSPLRPRSSSVRIFRKTYGVDAPFQSGRMELLLKSSVLCAVQ